MVDSVNASGSLGVQAYRGSEGLSGEAMMAYISTRLNSINGDVSAMMDEQLDNLAKKKALQEVRVLFLEGKNDSGHSSKWSKEAHDYATSLPDGSPEKIAADAAVRGLNAGKKESTGFWDAKIADLDKDLDALGSQSELTMIRMQQLMSQRQTAIQLTTNILSKFNQGDEAIVANIR